MTAEELYDRLRKAASRLGLTANNAPEFVAPCFRGRADPTTAPLPDKAYGLRLGAYPVVVAPVALGSVEEMQASLRKLHTQMVIARSYMHADEVINAHIFLCAVDPANSGDWRSVVDLAERDEGVCRKVVWIPDAAALDASFESFRSRTFLASPWDAADERRDAPLDSNQGLAQRLLVQHGLTDEVAAAWIGVVGRLREDPETMVSQLVAARGSRL